MSLSNYFHPFQNSIYMYLPKAGSTRRPEKNNWNTEQNSVTNFSGMKRDNLTVSFYSSFKRVDVHVQRDHLCS